MNCTYEMKMMTKPDWIDELLFHALVAGDLNGDVHQIVQLLLQAAAAGPFPPLRPALRLRQILKRDLRRPEGALHTLTVSVAAAGCGGGGDGGFAAVVAAIGGLSLALILLLNGGGGRDGDLRNGHHRLLLLLQRRYWRPAWAALTTAARVMAEN